MFFFYLLKQFFLHTISLDLSLDLSIHLIVFLWSTLHPSHQLAYVWSSCVSLSIHSSPISPTGVCVKFLCFSVYPLVTHLTNWRMCEVPMFLCVSTRHPSYQQAYVWSSYVSLCIHSSPISPTGVCVKFLCFSVYPLFTHLTNWRMCEVPVFLCLSTLHPSHQLAYVWSSCVSLSIHSSPILPTGVCVQFLCFSVYPLVTHLTNWRMCEVPMFLCVSTLHPSYQLAYVCSSCVSLCIHSSPISPTGVCVQFLCFSVYPLFTHLTNRRMCAVPVFLCLSTRHPSHQQAYVWSSCVSLSIHSSPISPTGVCVKFLCFSVYPLVTHLTNWRMCEVPMFLCVSTRHPSYQQAYVWSSYVSLCIHSSPISPTGVCVQFLCFSVYPLVTHLTNWRMCEVPMFLCVSTRHPSHQLEYVWSSCVSLSIHSSPISSTGVCVKFLCFSVYPLVTHLTNWRVCEVPVFLCLSTRHPFHQLAYVWSSCVSLSIHSSPISPTGVCVKFLCFSVYPLVTHLTNRRMCEVPVFLCLSTRHPSYQLACVWSFCVSLSIHSSPIHQLAYVWSSCVSERFPKILEDGWKKQTALFYWKFFWNCW